MDRTGMTLKQFALHRFLKLIEQYKEVKRRGLKTDMDRAAFIVLSVQIHAAKGDVPKSWWPIQ